MRYVYSYTQFYGRLPTEDIMEGIIVPNICKMGTYKMRISYNDISKKVEFEKYTVTDIKTLKIIENNSIEYGLKYTDRSYLDHLCLKKEGCDDILIIKNGMVLESSICNIVLFDGHEWITPSNPLLKGTARERLLKLGKIKESNIRVSELSNYQSFKLINAMRDFESLKELDIKGILK